MNEQNLSKKILSGMKWKAVERVFLQIVNAVTPIVLARILTPDDFGIIAILSVFISIAHTLVHNGLGNAIIQKKDSDDIDASTVFYAQLAISFICYFVLYFSAPYIAKFYNNSDLTVMLRVMSISLVIGALGAMQVTILKKKMLFNKSFISTGLSTVAYGAVGIGCAYLKFGAWSLVYANIAQSTVLSLSSIIVIKWLPKLEFSFNRLKQLFAFSWKLTVGWLIGTIHQDLYTLVVGKRFSNAILGYYNRALSFPHIFSKTITEVVDGVMFPALSTIQDDKEQLRQMTRKLMSVNAFVIFPVFLGLSAVAKPLVILLLTKKWLPSVPMMQIMCVTLALNSLNNSNMQVFNSMGRSDIFMKFEMIKRSISIGLLIVASFISIYAVILVLLCMAILSNMMNAYQNNKLLGYKYSQIIRDVLPSFITAIIMALITYFVGILLEKLNLHYVAILAIQLSVGALVYVIIAYLAKIESLTDVIGIIKGIIKKKK